MSEEKEQKVISAKEYAEMKGKDKSWGSRLAKFADDNKYPHPSRVGNYWVATYEQWEELLKKSGLQLRNRDKIKKEADQ